jgi:fluoride ion exporter CrcB/FEX
MLHSERSNKMQLDMGIGAFAVVIVAALVLGFLVQMFLKPKTPYEWLITGVGAGVGGWLASEITWTQWFAGLTELGPQFDGLLIIPAVIGGLVIGAIFEGLARVVEGPEATLA